MKQLSFDFDMQIKPKEYKIYTRLPVSRVGRAPLVHVSRQANFDIQDGDHVELFATERNLNVGTGVVLDVWQGKFADIPARYLQIHESGLHTFNDIGHYLYNSQFNTDTINDDITIVVYSFIN